jgi:hypothetical protein
MWREMRHVRNCTEEGQRHSSPYEGFGGGAFANSGVEEGYPVAGDRERRVGDEDKRPHGMEETPGTDQ